MTTNDRPQGQNERIEPTMDDKNEPIMDAQAGDAEDPDPALDVNNTPTSPGSGTPGNSPPPETGGPSNTNTADMTRLR